ncbi:MAG TPA: hypothetical protein VLX59_05305, partial [Acidimicrobiales bacterium]|nr:hypothetical protein [Acidimicrobiales bacterium]
VRTGMVTSLSRSGTGFRVEFDAGEAMAVDSVVAATGISHFQQLPQWAASIAGDVALHTCDRITFDDLDGARVLIVGGRQSAYEWAALAGEHGAERVDIVHRHEIPQFGRVSWKFADPYVEQTLVTPGWWRNLKASEQEAISRQFWEAGRLTLEWWLTPRLAGDRFHRWAHNSVASVATEPSGSLSVLLASGDRLAADRIIYATGYKASLAQLPYLAGVLDEVSTADGFPVLDEGFQSSIKGLYFPGFTSTRDFGPFFGFTKGCPAAATLVVDDLCR